MPPFERTLFVGWGDSRVTSTGGWLDLERRRLATPPDSLRARMAEMMRADDFEVLPSSTS